MYKLKKGYLLGDDFQVIIENLKEKVDIVWYEPIRLSNDKLETIFWSNINEILKCDYVLVNEENTNTFEMGIAWTINYIRKLLTRSGHKSAVQQLDKFGLSNKEIIGIKYTDKITYTQTAIKDQGHEFKNNKSVINYIKNVEK